MTGFCARSSTICAVLASSVASAQSLPETHLWLLELGSANHSAPVRITSSTGYHNQPAFSPDGQALFYTCERTGGQTDICRYDIAEQRIHEIHQSAESEYSPTPIPGQHALSVIRVEADARQRLWRIPLDGGKTTVLWPQVAPVGYHAWLDESTAMLFILGETFDLHLAETGTQGSRRIYSNIGRTLRKHPLTGAGLFVDKNQEPWAITSLDAQSGHTEVVIKLLPGVEDFEVDSSGRFWIGYGSKLYRSAPTGHGWLLEMDLSEWGVSGIT
ncbi:MAG: hypothetical protein HKN15_02470, partial [Xanthomonadales bacterium]|nr:hypothetical protein [Xanthomonadales bacterium]